jgi:hypothetical protein
MSKQDGMESGQAELNSGSCSVERLVGHICGSCGKPCESAPPWNVCDVCFEYVMSDECESEFLMFCQSRTKTLTGYEPSGPCEVRLANTHYQERGQKP